MPTIFTHAIVGYGLARLITHSFQVRDQYGLLSAVLPVIPDLDALLMPWIPYSHPLGHRGFSHSLFFAGVLALGASHFPSKITPVFSSGWLGLILFYWGITVSHGVLDAMTDGGLGIAFFAPFDNTRYFLPFRPIPVAPLGISSFFSSRGLQVFWVEFTLFWFFALAMIIWSWESVPLRKVLGSLLILAGIIAWGWRIRQLPRSFQ
ncbi:MAG TPA: metal-dependent hydrolase [Candidatus Limnocylindrales bacterium]|nr:metal-dependent hydrolase [Candidatus Limnocylindrales bacterium]